MYTSLPCRVTRILRKLTNVDSRAQSWLRFTSPFFLKHYKRVALPRANDTTAGTHGMKRKQALAFRRTALTIPTQPIFFNNTAFARQLPICNTTISNSKLVWAKWLANCTPQTKPPLSGTCSLVGLPRPSHV